MGVKFIVSDVDFFIGALTGCYLFVVAIAFLVTAPTERSEMLARFWPKRFVLMTALATLLLLSSYSIRKG